MVTVGIAATGTIVPPKFDAFGIFARAYFTSTHRSALAHILLRIEMNGEIDGTLSLDGSVSVCLLILTKRVSTKILIGLHNHRR